ncbi:MAG TPA: hypothetical protein K8V21_07625 [Weissella thailandensis]|uniref:hypothetical protein n=1 Tax=Weissella thailandensis TaxID=89061 RepID=UPI001DE3CEED|nr:hypothetical protein [Weissella thailandensis]HJG85235.1 hypothetical protein [Weissella thailandensis]
MQDNSELKYQMNLIDDLNWLLDDIMDTITKDKIDASGANVEMKGKMQRINAIYPTMNKVLNDLKVMIDAMPERTED